MDRKNILVAEDDEANFKFLEIIIKIAGYNVLWAENGKIAVELCANNDISLVFMDIRMPEMDGIEATLNIHTFKPELPVIAQTAYALTAEELSWQQAGFNRFITKPINRNTILMLIDEFITNK